MFVDDWGEGMGLKIDGSGQSSSGRMNKTVTGNIHVAGRNQSNFNSQLKKQTSQHLDETLKQMAQEIFKQGEQLSEKVDISQLKAYKRLISEFLNESARGRQISRESFLDRRGRHRLYVTVKKVNENLRNLPRKS